MASAGGSACHSDPNFAVICCFLEKYGEILGLPVISFVDLQEYLEDTKTVSRPLVDLHVRLLKRIGKTNVNHERFERSITKFCFYFSDHDGWEMERFGYRHAQLSTKLRVLKNLLECQFDYNVKFKEKINEFQPEELRFLPAGRDKDGMTYWYLLDKDLNVHIYREEPDDETAETWKLICSDRDQLAALLDRLRNNTQRNFGEEDKDDKDDKSSIFTDESKTTSKEGSPDRDTNSVAFALDAVKEEMDDVKHEPPDPASVVSAPQVQPSVTLTQTDKHEAANTASGSLIMKVKLEHVAEEQRPPEDAADLSNSAELQTENKASKPKKKAGKRKEKSPTGSDKGSEPSPNTTSVRNSRESSCEVIVEPSEGASKSDPSETTELDRSEAGKSDSSSVVAPSTESPPAVSSQPGETDEGSASKDTSVGESSGGVGDSSVGESSGGVKGTSVGESSGGVEDTSVGESSGGVKDSSVGESSGGVKDSSVGESSGGVKDTSVGESSGGVKDTSVGESSGGVKDSSVGESSSGVKDTSVSESSGEISGGVKDTSAGESSSGVKDTSVHESSGGVKDTSVSESGGGVKDTSVGKSSSGFKDSSVGESSSGVKDSSVSESSGGVKDSSVGESSSGVKDTSVSESSGGVKDSRAGESSSGAKRREDPLQGQRTDDESPEKKRRESNPESSVSNSTASASGSFHLTPGSEGVDKPGSDRKTEGEGEQVCQSAEECLTRFDLKTDDSESKIVEEVPAPHSKERIHEDQGPKEHNDKPQKEPDGKVSPVTSDKDKGDNANFDSEPKETVPENKTLPKECSDKSKITGASPEEMQVSGETDKNELSKQGDKDDSMTCKEGGESDVSRTECSGGSSEGTEPADSMAWKEALESSKDDSSTLGKQKEASEMKTEDPSPPPAASEKSDVDSSGQSVQMNEKEGQTSFVEEKAYKKESVAQISDCKSPSVKVDEKRESVSNKEDSAESKDSAESSSATSCASAVSENEGKGAVPLDVMSEVKALPLTADDMKTKETDQESEADELVASNERSENETRAKNGGMSETAPKEKMSGNDVDKSDKIKQNSDSESASEENVTVDHNESKETQPLNKNEAPSEKDTDSLKKAKIDEEEARVTESSCEMKTVSSRTDSKGSEGNDKAADASGGDQGTSNVSLPGPPDEEEEATSSEVAASEKLQEPKPEKGEVEHVSHDQDTKSENVKSAEESIDADKSALDHKLESEHSVSSPGQCSAEVKSLSHKLSSGGENNVKNNTALQNSVTKESSSAVDSKLAVTEDLSEETADSSKNEKKVDSKVVEIRVVRLEGSALSPGDKATAQSLASENSSKDSRIGECTANSDQKENASGKTIDSNDSPEIKTSVHDDKESSKCDATEIEGNVEKMEDKEAEPSRPRSLRKRRGRRAMKAKDTADADSVQKLNENTIKETRTSGKRKAENQSKCTNQQEAESEAKCADKPQAQDTIKSADKQDSEKLVNGHTDLGEEQEKDDAETADAKTTTKPMRGASRRGRGGSRGRGRGGRRGSRVAKRTAAEADSEEISTAPAEKRARRGGLKRRGAASRSLAKSLAQGKDDESSSDSNTPLINCKGQSKPSATKGGSPRKTPASKKAAVMEKDKDSSSSDDLPLSKAAKKKKIVGEDSSDFEPEEPIAPSKKSRVGKTPKPAAKTKKDERESMEKENEPVSAMSAYSTRRSLRIQTMKKKEPDPDFDILSEVGQSGDLSSEVELPSEEDSEDDDFKPHQGRNRRRQAALKKKEEEKVPMDDTPCLVCNNCTHPDMMLLCDSCDKGYHMACLRPPLMAIPEGDWFCPPCEHGKLIEKLTEYLRELDTNSRKKDRLVRRKERLAFVGISLDNILKEEKKPDVYPRKKVVDEKSEDEEEDAEEEQEEETEEEEREDDYIRPRRRKSKGAYSTQRRPSHRTGHSRKRHDREHSDDDDRADLPEEVYAKRTCRTRSAVSYQFKEYDDLIKSAIQEDLNDPKPPRPRPPGRSRGKDLSSLPGMYSDEAEEEMDTESTDQEGKSRGKDMSNILGMDSDEEKELRRRQKEEALAAAAASEGRPPPVVKRKNRRRLTMLDSDDNQDEDDDSEEFQLSESDEDSEASVEASQEEDDDLTEEDSGNWRPQRTWYNKAASRQTTRRGTCRSRSSRFDHFVVDDDYDSDELASKRRSTRNSTKRRVRYRDWESDSEESEMETEDSDVSLSELSSDDPEYRRRNDRKKARRKFTSETETSGSEFMVRINRAKKRRVAPSDSDEDSGSSQRQRSAKGRKASKSSKVSSKTKGRNRNVKCSEDDSATEVEDEVPKKKKNVLRDSSTEEEVKEAEDEYGEDEDTEVEGDSQQTEPVIHKTPVTGPQNEVKQTVTEKEEAAPAVEQESKQVSEAALATEKIPEFEPEQPKAAAKPKKPRGKGRGKRAVSQAEDLSEEDKPERVECGTDMQDDAPVSTIEPVSSAVSGSPAQQGPPPNFLNVSTDPSSVADSSSLKQGQNMPPFSAPVSAHPHPGEPPMQHPHGAPFRPCMEGGFPSQYERYPHPGPMGPQGQEGMRYPAPFPHGPYPMPGEGFRGHQPDTMQQPTSDKFFRPQAMVPYGPTGLTDGLRAHGQPGQGHREGFRPPFSQIERLRYPYRPTGPDGFQPQGPMRGFQPSGPHQEGSQPLGPPQDNTRHPGPVQAFQPSGQGQAVFPPRSQNQDNFQPQVSAHQSYRPGQEGFSAAGLRQGHRLPAPTLEAAQISNQERLQAGSGQERVQQAGSSQDRPHQAGPSQEQLQQAGQGQERLHQGGQGQERLQQAGPGQERLQQAGPGQEQLQTGPGQERIQAGPGQERCQLSGPGQDSVQRSAGKEAVHPPLAEHFHIHGQKGVRPPHPGMEGFRPPYPGQESFRPGQEGFGSPGSGQSFRFPYHADFRYHSPIRPQSSRLEGFRPPASGPATFPQPGQAQEAFRPAPQSPGVRPPAASQGFRPSGQEAFKVTGPGPEDLRSTGAQPGFKPPVSNQDTFRAPGPDSDRFRPPGPDSDRFRPPAPDSDRFRPPGPDSDRFRPPGPDSDRFRPPGPDSDRFRLPGSNSDRFRAPGPDSDRFRSPDPDSDRFRLPGPGSDRFRPPGPDSDRFRPPGPDSDRFRAPGPESDRFRPHVPVSGFSGKSPGHDQQQSGLEGFKHVNPGQRFPSPEGHGPTSSQESVQHMKVSDSVKPSGQESVPSPSHSQDRPQAQGPPQGFPFQHPQYEAFQMPGHGFWPPTTGFRPAGSHQRFWPPPGHHHMRPSGPVPEGFHLMGHPRGIHPSEHGQGAFPPGFRSAGMGEGYRPAFMSPGQIEGYRPQEPMGIGQSQQSHPTNLPFNATSLSAMQSVSGQSNPAQSHSSRNDVSQTQIRASEELKTDGSQHGGKMCAMTGSLESEDQENLQPQDLSVQSNRGGSQNCVEQDKSVGQSEESRPLQSHAQEEASKPVDLSQQSKGPSLQMSSGDLAEGCKPSRGTDGSKPLEGMKTVIPPLQGSEVKPLTPPEIEKGHEHQILPKQIEENQLEGRSENSEESKPQEQSESLPSESLPQTSKETQPENQAKHSEEIKSKGQSEGNEISTQQVSTELTEGTEIKETPKSDVSVPSGQEMSEGLTQDNEESRSQVPTERPDESGSEDPPGQAKESKKCPVQDKQGEGPERSKPEKSSGNVEESEEPKPGKCSSQVKEHEQSKPEGSSGQVEGPDDSKPAGSSDSMDRSKESHVQDNLRQTEESKSWGQGESEESSLQDVSGQSEAAITTNVCSGQSEEAKDTSTEDKDITHQDPSKQMESLKSQESVKQEREVTSQVTPSPSEGIKQAENDGVQKPASSEHALKPQGLTEDPRPEALPAQTEEITSKVPASQNEELGSKDVSENNDGQKQDPVEQSEGSKPQGSTGEIEEQPQPSSGQNECNTQEEETAKAHGPLRQDGFTPQFPSRPGEEYQTQDSPRTEASRPQGPWMQIERFRPPYPGGQGEDLRSPSLSGERLRPPFPPGEGSRPPVPPVEQFILQGPSGEGFRPPGPSGEGFRPPGPSGEGFRPQDPSGEGFRPQSSSSEGFKSVGPSEEGFRSPGSSGPVEESQQSGPLPGGEGFKGQMTPSHADGFKHPGATGGFHPPMSGQGEGFRMPMGPEGFRPHGPEGFHPQGHEGFQPRGFYPPFQGHPYYPPEAGQTFHGGPPPPGFGMYPPHQFSPDQRMFGPGGPGPYHPMMPPVSQVPGVPPAGRGGFMIDNLLRSKSGELPPPHMAPAVSTSSPQMTPPHSTPPHGTPPHATPPYATPPHGTPPHSTPPHVTPPHSTPPPQSQIQQLQPLQKKTSPSMEAGERVCKSPQTASQGDDGDDGDVSQIMSYVMNDEFFKEQTSS